MVLRVCPTCRGQRRVRYGTEIYQCPSCGGSGGMPLGTAPPARSTPRLGLPESNGGMSRANQHIARKRTADPPIPRR